VYFKLFVTVIEARDLPALDVGGTSDPYVKVRLMPKKKPVFSTKIIKANCNPLFNETFSFEVR
jgi:synaptotagmin-7